MRKCIKTALPASTSSPDRAPCAVKKAKAAKQREGADHDIAIDGDHTDQPLPGQNQGANGPAEGAKTPADQDHAQNRGACFARHCRPGNAGNAPVQAEHEGHAQRDIDAV